MLEETVKILDGSASVSIAYPMLKLFGDVDTNSGVPVGQEYDFELLLEKNFLPVCSLFRKSAWAQVHGYKLMSGYADWDFWISLGEAGHFGMLVRNAVFLYRKHGHSMFNVSFARHAELFAEIRKNHAQLYTQQVLDKILFHKDKQILELQKEIEKNHIDSENMKEELANLRTGRGSIRTAWKQIKSRLLG